MENIDKVIKKIQKGDNNFSKFNIGTLNAANHIVKSAANTIQWTLDAHKELIPGVSYSGATTGIDNYNAYAGIMGYQTINRDVFKLTQDEINLLKDAQPKLHGYYLVLEEVINSNKNNSTKAEKSDAEIMGYQTINRDVSTLTQDEVNLLKDTQPKLHGDYSVLEEVINSKKNNSTKAEKSESGFFSKLANAIVNFFTKALPSISIHPKEEKNSVESNVVQESNASKESTFAKTAKALSGNDPKKAQELLAKQFSTKEQKQTDMKEQENKNKQSTKIDIEIDNSSQKEFSDNLEQTHSAPRLG